MPPPNGRVEIQAGYRPGAIGEITRLHAGYYADAWGLDRRFEGEVARELAEFVARYERAPNGLWLACDGERTVGAIVIDGGDGQRLGARLRWFILEPAYHGQGIGRRLMQAAMDFCRDRGFPQVYLMTFAGLDRARRIYEAWGFRLVEEHVDADWNDAGVTHQTFVLSL